MTTELTPADAVREALYAERDVLALAGFYTSHIDAMTREGLHDKSDIAAELAYRDMVIAYLTNKAEAHARDAAAEKARLDWLAGGTDRTVWRAVGGEWAAQDDIIGCWYGATPRAAIDAAMQEPMP